MKTIRTILSTLAATGILVALAACTPAEVLEPVDTEDPGQSTSSSYPVAPPTDAEGRVLVYDDHGLWIYADTTITPVHNMKEGAPISFRWIITNNSDEDRTVDFDFREINGLQGSRYGSGGYVEPGETTTGWVDTQASCTNPEATCFDIPVSDCGFDCWSIDRSQPISVKGTYAIRDSYSTATGKWIDEGTFEFTLPPDFADEDFRVEQPWVSTF